MEISESGKKAIDSFVAWINECKNSKIYSVDYIGVPGKASRRGFSVSISKENLDDFEYSILLSTIFDHHMMMNFVPFCEMESLKDLAFSKGFWLVQ